MNTMIVKIPDSSDLKKIAAAVRQLKGVAEVKVQREKKGSECIQGLPYTREAILSDVCRAEEDYVEGRISSPEELGNRIAKW